MDIKKAIQIMEALASGYSPTTGELLQNESILNQRDVIRALQIAIDHIKNDNFTNQHKVDISAGDIQSAIKVFKDSERNPTPNNLSEFFLGTRTFKVNNILNHALYGKLKTTYSKGQLIDFFTDYLLENGYTFGTNQNKSVYKEIDYFQKDKFNRLSDKAILQLKEKINQLGIQKRDNLPEYILTARTTNPRAYEAWSNTETELLKKAIQFTNDLDLLSECFQRGKASIESCGQRLIYQSQQRSRL